MAQLEYLPWQVSEEQIASLSSQGFSFIKDLVLEVGLIKRELFKNVYEGLVATIVGQQLSDKAYQGILRKLPQSFFHDPVAIINYVKEHELKLANDAQRLIPLSDNKIATLKFIAQKFVSKEWSVEYLQALSSKERHDLLAQVKGVGPWTINMLEIFVFRNQNVFAKNDLAIKNAVLWLNDMVINKPSNKEVVILMDKYEQLALNSSLASILSFYLWALNALDSELKKKYQGAHKIAAFHTSHQNNALV